MIFVSGKKYQELKKMFKQMQEDRFQLARFLCESSDRFLAVCTKLVDLHMLRTIDKECIQALLDVVYAGGYTLEPFEKSLVDQTLNQ